MVFRSADPLPRYQQRQRSRIIVLWFTQEADSLELWFQYFGGWNHNMNKTCYSASKGEFVLAEERKTNKMNRTSETKEPK